MGNAAAIGRELRAHLSKTIYDALRRATAALRDSTPVDTTNAANNWMITTRAPYEGVDGSRAEPSHSVQDALLAEMADYDVVRDGKVFIRNNVLYVQYLDDGWSDQAPPGYVWTVFSNAADGATGERRAAVAKMLRGMAEHAYHRTL